MRKHLNCMTLIIGTNGDMLVNANNRFYQPTKESVKRINCLMASRKTISRVFYNITMNCFDHVTFIYPEKRES